MRTGIVGLVDRLIREVLFRATVPFWRDLEFPRKSLEQLQSTVGVSYGEELPTGPKRGKTESRAISKLVLVWKQARERTSSDLYNLMG